MQFSWLPDIMPQLLIAAGGLFIFCAGAFSRKKPAGLLFAAALCTVLLSGCVTVVVEPHANQFLSLIGVTAYDRFFVLLLLIITGLTLLFSDYYSNLRGIAGDEFFGLILFAALGMMLIAGALHWLVFYLGLETLAVALYVLIAINKTDELAAEAGIKYLVMGMVASAFLVFGIAMLYAACGTMDIRASLGAGASSAFRPLVLLGSCFILAGLGFKISLVPFHLWTPDVYQGAPAPVTAFLSTGSKVAVFAALLRLALYAAPSVWFYVVPALWILSAATMAIGTITALVQSHIKRLLAYSSIAHMGYLLMALLAIKHQAAPSIMYYLAAYALMELGAFGTVAVLSSAKADLDSLDDFCGLGYAHPWRSALLVLSLLSLAGIPPTVGFIGKFGLFQAAVLGDFIVLAVFGIVTVIVSIYVYLKVIILLYMRTAKQQVTIPGLTVSGKYACGLTLALILYLGIIPGPIFWVIMRALAQFTNY